MSLQALTVADIIERALWYAAEENGARHDEDDLVRLVSDAQTAALQGSNSRGIPGLTLGARNTLVSLADGQAEYPLDEEVKTITGVWHQESTTVWSRVPGIGYFGLGEIVLSEGSLPIEYYLRQNVIGFIPVPSTDQSDVIRIDFYAWGSALTATTDSIFGGQNELKAYQHILQHYVTGQLLRRDGKHDQAKTWEELFWTGVNDAGAAQRNPSVDAAAVIQARAFGGEKVTRSPGYHVVIPPSP